MPTITDSLQVLQQNSLTSAQPDRFGVYTGNSDPIQEKSNPAINVYTFPSDLPKHYFQINEFQYVGINIADLPKIKNPFNKTLQTIYRLPLPVQFSEAKHIAFDTQFSYLEVGASMAGGVAGQIIKGGPAIAAAVSAGTLTTNNLRMVTLAAPNFGEFNLSFSLTPQNFKESQAIKKIYFNLKKYAHPKAVDNTARMILGFPRIYLLQFQPGPEYLFKFKPCVIKDISINYTPHGTPAFYKAAVNSSVPEAVTMTIGFLELEYWLQDDFHDTNEPFDGLSPFSKSFFSLT